MRNQLNFRIIERIPNNEHLVYQPQHNTAETALLEHIFYIRNICIERMSFKVKALLLNCYATHRKYVVQLEMINALYYI